MLHSPVNCNETAATTIHVGKSRVKMVGYFILVDQVSPTVEDILILLNLIKKSNVITAVHANEHNKLQCNATATVMQATLEMETFADINISRSEVKRLAQRHV